MARESALEERERQDKEKADAIRKRQIRLGHIPNPAKAEEGTEEGTEEEPKSKSRARAKK